MKTILEENKNVMSILGEQKYDSSICYRIMHFVAVEKKQNGTRVLFNNMTKGLCVLDNEESKAFEKFDFNNDTVKSLLKSWYIVPQKFEEANAFDQIRDLYLSVQHAEFTGLNTFTILPTTECNARCYYCYETGCKKSTMSTKTAHDVADYIKKNIKSDKAHLRWFGGEPLVAHDKIDIICNDLLKYGIEISSDIISNGYLFDEQTVKKSKELWNLQFAQITLDGTENTYNAVKNYISGNNPSPFIQVIDNIDEMLKNDIRILIRINISDNNEKDARRLIKFLSERFDAYKDSVDKQNYRLLTVYVHTLFQDIFDSDGSFNSEDELNKIYDRECKMESFIKSNNLGVKISLPRSIRANHCMADNSCSAVILPDGGLTVCEHQVYGDTNFGSIYSDVRDENLIADWKKRYPRDEKCNTCMCYPSCLRLKNCPNVSQKCSLAYQNFEINKIKASLRYV